jgi:hypothetical protein
VNEVLNGPAGSIRQFSEFSHHTLIEFVQWREAPKNEGQDVLRQCFHVAFCAPFGATARNFCRTIVRPNCDSNFALGKAPLIRKKLVDSLITADRMAVLRKSRSLLLRQRNDASIRGKGRSNAGEKLIATLRLDEKSCRSRRQRFPAHNSIVVCSQDNDPGRR